MDQVEHERRVRDVFAAIRGWLEGMEAECLAPGSRVDVEFARPPVDVTTAGDDGRAVRIPGRVVRIPGPEARLDLRATFGGWSAEAERAKLAGRDEAAGPGPDSWRDRPPLL